MMTKGMINKAAKNPPAAPAAEVPVGVLVLRLDEVEEVDFEELDELDFEPLLEELDEWLVLWPTAASTILT